MQKTLTKEELAARLDGIEYRDSIPRELLEAAKNNNLVIISGESDDLIEFNGAITEEIGVCSTVRLTRDGVLENDCGNNKCPYFMSWLTTALKRGDVREIKVFWAGERGEGEYMDTAKYVELGEPTWCFETTMPYAAFSIFDTNGDDREYYCRGVIIDLDEIWPTLNYTQWVMEVGNNER